MEASWPIWKWRGSEWCATTPERQEECSLTSSARVHPLFSDWIMFPLCSNCRGWEDTKGCGSSCEVQLPWPALLPVLLPFFPPMGCMQSRATWALPWGKNLPFAGIQPACCREHPGEEGLLVFWGRRPFSQPSCASYRVRQRILICVALHSLLLSQISCKLKTWYWVLGNCWFKIGEFVGLFEPAPWPTAACTSEKHKVG